MYFLKYLTSIATILVILFSLLQGGIWVFFAPFYAFFLIPFLELFIPASTENYSKAEEEILKKDPKFDWLLWSIVLLQYTLLIVFLNAYSNTSNPLWERIGSVIAFGISCGVFGINVAHELGHRNTWYEQVMAKLLLLTSLYLHFFIEHNRGHHKNVSTDLDPASSRRGETVYAFWFRSIKDGYISAWHLENERLKKLGKPFFSLENEMLVFQFAQLGIVLCIFFIFGLQTAGAFVGAALIGITLLETVNYIEHYGLRRKLMDGSYFDKVMPIHSWNSNHPMGRLVLFELSRHSDHHYLPSRKYQVLRHFDNSPQMPTGYPGMMVLSLIPPLWFKIMHQQIEKYKLTEAGAGLA